MGLLALLCTTHLKILGEISLDGYPITPGYAIAGHFIPFYNLYWIFKWPNQIADFLNANSPIQQMSKGGIGIVILLAILIGRAFDGFVSLIVLFAVIAYLNGKIRHVLELQFAQVPPSSTSQTIDSKNADNSKEYYCSDCGHRVFPGDKFYRSCNEPLEWDNGQQEESHRTAESEDDFAQTLPFESRFASDAEKAKRYSRILGLKGKVTINDIKERYKELIAKYHPDKVQHLGEEFQSIAEQKTKEINQAYEYFKKKYLFN